MSVLYLDACLLASLCIDQ